MGSSGAGFQQQAALLSSLGMSSSVVDTSPRKAGVGNQPVYVTGTTYLTYFTPLVSLTVSTITGVVGTTNSSSLTLARMGLYTAAANGDVTLVARTANNTSLFGTANTAYAEALATTGGFPATYALVAGVRYAVGVLQVGSTIGRIFSSFMGGAVGLLLPVEGAAVSGQTDIDGNLSSVGSASLNSTPWFRLS